MPLDSLELRTSLQRVLVGLILILVPLTVFGFYVALQADSQIRQTAGENVRYVTRSAAEFTSEFIAVRLRDVSVITNDPNVLQSVVSANRQYERLSEAAALSKVHPRGEMDKLGGRRLGEKYPRLRFGPPTPSHAGAES